LLAAAAVVVVAAVVAVAVGIVVRLGVVRMIYARRFGSAQIVRMVRRRVV